MTNFEKIKEDVANMTVEEMAANDYFDAQICDGIDWCGVEKCTECKIKWLEIEVKE